MKIEGGADHIKITLNFHQRQMLRLIAERGGSIDFKFGASSVQAGEKAFTEEERREIIRGSDESIKAMEKMGLTKHVPIIGLTDTWKISLTDIGRNVIEQMKIIVEPAVQTIKLQKNGI